MNPFDAAILIGIALVSGAAGLQNHREATVAVRKSWEGPFADSWSPGVRAILGPALRLESDLNAALVVATLGLGLVALRRPAVPRRGRWLGRGRAALLAGLIVIGYAWVRALIEAGSTGPLIALWPPPPSFVYETLAACGRDIKWGILGAWSLLALAGHWRSEAGWLERGGLFLGWCWLLSIVTGMVRYSIY